MAFDKRYGTISNSILLFVVIGLLLAGCNAPKNQNSLKNLTHIKLNKDIIQFTFENIPRIYSGLVSIDNEIMLIENEFERLKEIENQYPRQLKIVAIEEANWINIKRSLLDDLETLEKNIERLYVTYMVNKDKGNALIEEKSETIITAIDTALNISTPDTTRLKPVPKKSFVARIKDKISS